MLDRMDYEERRQAAYDLLCICQKYAPTGKVQQAFTNLYNELKENTSDDVHIIDRLCSVLIDGIRYGNWPHQD